MRVGFGQKESRVATVIIPGLGLFWVSALGSVFLVLLL